MYMTTTYLDRADTHILIIDDDDNAIEVLEWELSKFADRINITAKFTSALEGLDFIRDNTIDALFLDIQMPTISGFDLLKLISICR